VSVGCRVFFVKGAKSSERRREGGFIAARTSQDG